MSSIETQKFTLDTDESIKLRTAIPEDAHKTLALYKSVIQEGRFTLYQIEEFDRDVEQEREAIGKELKSSGNLRIVTEVDGEIVGMARVREGIVKRTSHFGEVDSVWVAEAWRGRGIGGMMVDALISWAEATNQIEKLGLFVFSTSKAAIRLYESRGFAIEGHAPRDIKFGPDDYAATIIMGRRTG
jgi:ribosomal protein S18 acetylase RimI-like enzyme